MSFHSYVTNKIIVTHFYLRCRPILFFVVCTSCNTVQKVCTSCNTVQKVCTSCNTVQKVCTSCNTVQNRSATLPDSGFVFTHSLNVRNSLSKDTIPKIEAILIISCKILQKLLRFLSLRKLLLLLLIASLKFLIHKYQSILQHCNVYKIL